MIASTASHFWIIFDNLLFLKHSSLKSMNQLITQSAKTSFLMISMHFYKTKLTYSDTTDIL